MYIHSCSSSLCPPLCLRNVSPRLPEALMTEKQNKTKQGFLFTSSDENLCICFLLPKGICSTKQQQTNKKQMVVICFSYTHLLPYFSWIHWCYNRISLTLHECFLPRLCICALNVKKSVNKQNNDIYLCMACTLFLFSFQVLMWQSGTAFNCL